METGKIIKIQFVSYHGTMLTISSCDDGLFELATTVLHTQPISKRTFVKEIKAKKYVPNTPAARTLYLGSKL